MSSRRLGAADGLPSLPTIDLVMVRMPSNLNPAAARLADYISQRLDTVEPFRSYEQSLE